MDEQAYRRFCRRLDAMQRQLQEMKQGLPCRKTTYWVRTYKVQRHQRTRVTVFPKKP